MVRQILLLIVALSISAPASAWSGVVIHHTASPEWTTVADIDRWHKERGFDEIGYHYVIGRSGSVQAGRGLHKAGAHALNPRPSRNRTHIGIALVGYDQFTESQYKSVRVLLRQLRQQYGDLVIETHHEKCPGTGFEFGKLTVVNG